MKEAEQNRRVFQARETARISFAGKLLLKAESARVVAGKIFSTGVLKQRGVSLIELIIFIVIISTAMVGILSVMKVTTGHSADPLLHKQAIAAAESLLEEIELQDFIDQNDNVTFVCPSPASAVTAATRSTAVYHIVDCYNGLTTTKDMSNNFSLGVGTYTANVAIDKTTSPLGAGATAIAAGSSVRITVTVTDPQSTQISIDGYRTKYQ